MTSCWRDGTCTLPSADLHADAEPLERRPDRHEVLRVGAFDRDVAARDRGHADEAADLDVIGADRPRAAVQLLDAVDAQDVRLDAVDLRAEGDEEPAQVLHVRLARRVAEDGLARREDGSHEGVLRRHDARLVEEDVRAAQPVGPAARTDAPTSTWAPSSAKAWMCGSSRLRPMTSPPGGAIVALPKRESSGPARRNDARMRLQRRGSGLDLATFAVCTRTSFGPAQPMSAPRSASSSIIVSTSLIRGTFSRTTGSVVRRVAARIGRAPFLFPAARMVPFSGREPSMTNASATAGATAMGGYPSRVSAPTREQAWQTLTKYTKSESLLRHALAVEASTAAYARKLGGDEELWRVSALLHDFDYEMHPTLDKHPQDGAPILREEGYPEEVIDTVLSHAEHLGLPAGHAAEEGALRVRRAVRIRARVRARPADRARGPRAEVGAQEAQAAVVRVGRPPRGRLQGRRGARRRARRPHP